MFFYSQQDATKKIKTRMGKSVSVRNMVIQDDSDKISVALWQECTTIEIQEGQKVMVKDVLVGHNNMTDEHSVSINDVDDIEVCIS